MAFPTTGILDDFTGTENPISTGWTGPIYPGETQLQKASGTLRGGAGNSYYNTSFSADQEAFVTIAVLPGDGFTLSLFARIANPNNASLDAYRVQFIYNAVGNDVVRIRRVDNTSSTTLGGDILQDFSVGDGLGIECIGSTISAYRRSGGIWSLLGSRTDSTYSAGGFTGVELADGTCQIDDFGGGTIGGQPNFDPVIGGWGAC